MNKRRQRGDSLLITLMILVVMALGFVYAARNIMADTMITGNNLVRQKDTQVIDVAMRNLESLITSAVTAGQGLESLATPPAWYRTVTPGTAGPNTLSYWQNCLGNSSTASQCGSIPVTISGNTTALPYTVLAAVQPTGHTVVGGCASGYTAIYYDVFLFVYEGTGTASSLTGSSNITSASVETLYRLCTPGG